MRLTRESRYNQSALLSHTAIWRCVSAAVVLLSLAFQPTPNVAFAAPFAYVTNAGAGTVSVVDAATNLVSISGIPVGSLPEQVAAKPDGTLVYVTNTGSGTVSVITTATNTVLTTIPVGSAPSGLAVTPNGSHVYVANSGSNSVSVITTATNTVLGGPIPVGATPAGVAVTPNGSHVYVANSGSNSVSVIATATNTVLTTIPVGAAPTGVAIARSNIASIPILSDPAIWLLIVAMSVGLTLRMMAKPAPSRRRTSRLI